MTSANINQTIENALWNYATKFAGNSNVKDARRSLLAALEAEGLTVVPVEPTPEMVNAGALSIPKNEGLKAAYRAMIAAAKEPEHDDG